MRALVLSGGGSRGAYEVGVLRKVMQDEQRDYDILAGVSVGALNVGCLAQVKKGQPRAAYAKLKAVWDTIDDKAIYSKWAAWPASVPWKASVFCTEPMRKLVLANFDQQAVVDSGRLLRIGVVSWDTGAYKSVTERAPNLAWWIMASAAYPVMFEPIKVGDQVYGDGGIRNVTPLAEVIRMGAKEIDVILASNPSDSVRWEPKTKRTTDYLFRMLSITFDEVMLNDLRGLGVGSEFVQLKPEYQDVKIRVQMPSVGSMGYFDSLDFDPKKIEAMMALGYRQAYEENF